MGAHHLYASSEISNENMGLITLTLRWGRGLDCRIPDGVVLRATNGVSEGRRKHSVSSVNGTLSDHSRQKKHKSRDVLLDSSREDANSKTSTRSAMRRLDPKVGAIEMTDGIRKKSSLASSRSTGGGGTYVPPTILRQSVSLMIESILIKPSCFLPAVIKKNI